MPLSKTLSERLTCRTIHSLLYREIAPDPGLYLPRNLAKYASNFGLAFSPAFLSNLDKEDENLRDDLTDSMDDLAYIEVQRLRAMMKTWRDTRFVGPMADRVKFMWKLHDDGFERGFWDFTSLLEEGIKRGTSWSADYCAVDEINDLNALQATLAARITGERVEYVGDLDQAIYGFAGVDPQRILQILHYDDVETMELSYRLTPPIAEAAERCLAQATWRSEGRIKTERIGGKYHERQVIENVLGILRNDYASFKDIYVIGRTNWIVGKVRAMAIKTGMNVAQSGDEELLQAFCKIVADPQPNMTHSMVPALTASFLPASDYYRRGAKAALLRLASEKPDGWMSWSDFHSNYGTERLKRTLAGEWGDWYYGRQIDPSKPVIRFDTFHAAKGMEADTVVVLRDITERVENEGVRDEEIRLAYVAITRGREQIFPADVDYGWMNRWIPTSGV